MNCEKCHRSSSEWNSPKNSFKWQFQHYQYVNIWLLEGFHIYKVKVHACTCKPVSLNVNIYATVSFPAQPKLYFSNMDFILKSHTLFVSLFIELLFSAFTVCVSAVKGKMKNNCHVCHKPT